MNAIHVEVMNKARQFGFILTIDQCEAIIWQATGYPCFWPNKKKTPVQNFQKQLYDFFKRARALGSLSAAVTEIYDEMDRQLEEFKKTHPNER